MKRLLFLLLFLLLSSTSYAAPRFVLQDGSGVEKGTTSNPVTVNFSGDVSLANNLTVDTLFIRDWLQEDTSHTTIAISHDLSIASYNTNTVDKMWKEVLTADIYIESMQLEEFLTPAGDLTVSVKIDGSEIGAPWAHDSAKIGPVITVNTKYSAGSLLTIEQKNHEIASDLSNDGLVHFFYELRSEPTTQ